MGGYLSLVLVGNSILDLALFLASFQFDPSIVEHRLFPGFKKTASLEVRSAGHLFLFHAIVRFVGSQNLDNPLARQLTALSYGLEAFHFISEVALFQTIPFAKAAPIIVSTSFLACYLLTI